MSLGEQSLWAESLVEEEGLFEVHRFEDRGYDKEGWLDVGDTMRAIVAAIVAALETGAEQQVTTGNDLRHALEMAIALRQSHRCWPPGDCAAARGEILSYVPGKGALALAKMRSTGRNGTWNRWRPKKPMNKV